MKHVFFCGASAAAVVMSAGLWAGPSAAAEAPAPTEVEEVVVTGSYIAGTPQNSALPVSVIGAEDLAKQGSPTVVNIVKNLPAAAGSVVEANRLMGATAGVATVNLRGFGAQRTLVLFNGRRLAPSVSVAVVGAVGCVGYLFQPQLLLLFGKPYFFVWNFRYVGASMALALVLLPVGRLFDRAALCWAVLGAYVAVIVVMQFDSAIWPLVETTVTSLGRKAAATATAPSSRPPGSLRRSSTMPLRAGSVL